MGKRGRKPIIKIEDHERARIMFLETAGVADTAPYADDGSVQATIERVKDGADITLEQIGKSLGLTYQRVRQLIADASRYNSQDSAKSPAARLGAAMRPLLRQRLEEGALHPGNFLPVRSREENAIERDRKWKAEILSAVGVTDGSAYDGLDARATLRTLRDQAELTNETLAPESKDHSYVDSRLADNVALNAEFVEHACGVLKAALDRGIEEGWIDPATRKAKPVEAIISEITGLTAEQLGHATGLHAVLNAAERAGLPEMALGPMVGGALNRIACAKQQKVLFTPSETAQLAHKLLPYLKGEKTWKGRVEVTDPEALQTHRFLRHRFVLAVTEGLREQRRGKEAEAFTAFCGGENAENYDSLGDLLRAVRASLGFSQYDMGMAQSCYRQYETNHFSCATYNNDGELKENIDRDLCAIAEVVVQHWPSRNAAPDPNQVVSEEEGRLPNAAAPEKRVPRRG